jgi:hypothetical protein
LLFSLISFLFSVLELLERLTWTLPDLAAMLEEKVSLSGGRILINIAHFQKVGLKMMLATATV